MLMIWLKKREEFLKVCQGKAVFYSVNDGCIHYFAPAKVNEIEMLYAFDSQAPLQFREHYDLEDAEGVHVWQLIEISGLCFFDTPGNIVNPEMQSIEKVRAY